MHDTTLPVESSAATYASKAISYILHPFLIPLYLIFAIFGSGLVPMYVSASMERYLFGLITVSTVFIPAMAIIILRLFRIIPDYSLTTRHDRILPLLIVAFSYGMCGWVLQDVQMAFLLRRCVFAAMGCVIFAFVLNLFWQVSLHMTAVGGAVGIISILVYGGYVKLVWVLCAAILLAGLLGSARLYLGKHDLLQVAAGFFGGFFISILILLFFG